jgi:hypothetical protein
MNHTPDESMLESGKGKGRIERSTKKKEKKEFNSPFGLGYVFILDDRLFSVPRRRSMTKTAASVASAELPCV